MKVDIGGGTIPRNGYINLDPAHGTGEFRRYIQDGIPVPDGTLDAAHASHVMEHIPAGAGPGERVWVMNEVWRALKPGGEFTIIVPLFMAHGTLVGTWHAIADPTHVSFWALPESFLYFCDVPGWKPNADYGMKVWAAPADGVMRVEGGWEGHVTMRKPA